MPHIREMLSVLKRLFVEESCALIQNKVPRIDWWTEVIEHVFDELWESDPTECTDADLWINDEAYSLYPVWRRMKDCLLTRTDR